MTKRQRRPTTRDRDIVDYLEALPDGNHTLILEHDGVIPPIMPEGGFIAPIPRGFRRMILIPTIPIKRKAG